MSWLQELEGSGLGKEEKTAAIKNTEEFLRISKWFRESGRELPPGVEVLFVGECSTIIRSLGYELNLYPGMMPS